MPKEKVVSPEVLTLSALLTPKRSDDKTSVKIPKFEDNLPDGFTAEQVKQLAEYNGNYVAAGTLSITNDAYAIFQEDATVTKVTGDIKTPFIKSHVSVVKEKVTQTPNFGNAGAVSDPITTFGKVLVKHKVNHPGLVAIIESSEKLASTLFSSK